MAVGFNVASSTGALGRNRTCDLRFRKPLLYPLSYEGGDGAKCGAKFADTRCITVDKASAALLQKEYCPQNPLFVYAGTDLPVNTHSGRQRTIARGCLKRS